MTTNYLKVLLYYIDSVYKIGNEIKSLKDGRTNKKITTTAISFVVLMGFMLKIRSFNQLDDWLENKDLEKLFLKKCSYLE